MNISNDVYKGLSHNQKAFMQALEECTSPRKTTSLMPSFILADRVYDAGDHAVQITMGKGNKRLSLYEFNNLGSPRKGNAHAAMRCITALADEHRVGLQLRAVAELSDGNIPQSELIRFYENHRFFLQPQDNRESIGPIMLRPPQHSWF